MQQTSELLNAGIYESVMPETKTTVGELLDELDLTLSNFGVLVNGQKADMDDTISPEDKVIVIPHIRGGY